MSDTNTETSKTAVNSNILKAYTYTSTTTKTLSNIVSVSGTDAGVLVPYSFGFEDKERLFISMDGVHEVLEIVISSYMEKHSEVHVPVQSVSDSVSVFTYGANPVEISLSGYVMATPSTDFYIVFLSNYKNTYRARLMTNSASTLSLTFEGTSYIFTILNVSFTQSVDLEGWYTVEISGIGWDYNMSEDTSSGMSYQYYTIENKENVKEQHSGYVEGDEDNPYLIEDDEVEAAQNNV